MDSDLTAGDYIKIYFEGNWTFILNQSTILEGVNSNSEYTAKLEAVYNWSNQ